MLELNKIKRSMHADVISSFWTMLQTVETQADNEEDPILKIQVEGFYRQWNRMTGDDKIPVWKRRLAASAQRSAATNGERVLEIAAETRKAGTVYDRLPEEVITRPRNFKEM